MQKILIIEDEDPVRENIMELLEAEGYRSLGAHDGPAGVALARSERPHLIICDILMPHLDGYGVWGILSKDQATSTIPFIFLTAKTDRQDLRKGMELGADDYITKPFTRDELLRAIHARFHKQDVLTRHAQRKLSELRSNISLALPHELLTPLSSILGYSELLSQDLPGITYGQIIEMSNEIHSAGERLLRTIQNYLFFAELELASTDPRKVQVFRNGWLESVKPVIEEYIHAFGQVPVLGRGVHFEIEDASVGMAEIYIQKILEELLDNAMKYSPVEKPVGVEGMVDWEKHVYCLKVWDEGRGMTSDQIAEVASFVQFDRRVYEQQGSGLGLAIVKRLADLHGGDILITSIPGKRTVVEVIIPLHEN
jgi:signal transduction histidine kinase